MEYRLATETWNDDEINAACDVIKSRKCTMGEKCKQYEEEFAKFFGSKYAIFSNSGSSANLLMMTALMYRNNGPKLKIGDEVIVPAVSWSTTYYPLHQNGLVCSFVDIDLNTLNIDIEAIERAITPKTKAILAVNLLGNPNQFDDISAICEKHNLILLEDNCESMGATFKGKQCGTFGLMGTFSSFFSHHMCTIEGGITLTNDEELYQIMISLRAHGWTRGLPDINFVHNKDGILFNDLFRFVLPGYNLRPNEVFAALGLEQLKKLPQMIKDRQSNAEYFKSKIAQFKNVIIQTPSNDSESSWFGFSLLFIDDLKDKKNQIAAKLMEANIECRPIVAGNFAKNPVIAHMKHKINGDLQIANYIDKNGLFIGNNHGDNSKQIDYFIEVLKEIIKTV